MPSRRKKLRFYSIYVPVLLIFFFAVAEILARVAGYQPWVIKTNNIKVEPGGRLFEKDATLGYRALPGQFKITLGGAYVFTITNLSDASRATHPPDNGNIPGPKQGLWIFGDSVTYGWSVSDQETFPWLLQEDFRNYEVVNFATTGYGTLHSLIQLRAALQQRKPPRLVIFVYASWLDFRATPNRRRKKMFASFMGPVNHPYASLTGDGKIDISQDPLQYRAFPLVRYSAFMNMLDEIYTKFEEGSFDSHRVTKAIVKEMAELCRSNGTELVVGNLTSNPTTDDMNNYCRSLGVKTVDMFVDLGIQENSNQPYDIHPSAIAHRKYEQKLKPFLQDLLANDRQN